MTVVVTHTTPADGTFSAAGAAAWDADHDLSGLGTLAEQDANAVAITGGAINGVPLGTTTPAAGTFTTLTATGQTSLGGAAGAEGLRVVTVASSTRFLTAQGSAADEVYLTASGPSGSNVALALSSRSTGAVRFYTNTANQEQMRVSHTASAVNFVQVTGNVTGSRPIISAQGSDSNIGLNLASKGNRSITLLTNSVTAFDVLSPASGVNHLTANGSITGIAPSLVASGTDTNISQVFQSKGTGAINLAPGSSGVNISNGGTVTAITRTATGNGSYTSKPTVVISAPTTAGGVQATATIDTMGVLLGTVVSGGTGYTVGNTLTVVGGTGGPQTFTVATVSGGVVTGVTNASFSSYSTLPTNPVSTTGGTGSGCTLNLGYNVNNAFTITNAGSGYVEQPTVTFSGGGGSGAAAYATVGSNTIVRSLGGTMSFNTPGGEALRVADLGGTVVAGLGVFAGSSSQNSVYLTPFGSVPNGNLIIAAKGTQFVAIGTNANNNSNAIEQARIAHTASAVNFVQVTGAATANTPNITAQGSDTNVSIYVSSKGTGTVRFFTNGAGSEQFRVLHTAGTIVNYAAATGSATGAAPAFSVAGTDTNIDLALTPKGTGNVRFGTYTANMALTIQGYIEIKDSGGTVRKLAVIA